MSNETKVGLTVLAAVIVAIIGFRFMTDVPLFRQSLEITATFDRVDGISSGSVVYVHGVKVGSVSEVSLAPDGNVQTTLRIDSKYQIPRGTVANLTSLGIVEGKSIVLQLGDSAEMVEYGEEIEGRYVDSITEVLSKKGDELGDDVSASISELNTFLQQLNETLDDDTRQSLEQTLSSSARAANRISTILEEKQQDINTAIESGSRMMSQLDTLATDNRPRVDSLLTTLEYQVSELEKIRVELEGASGNLNEILVKINQGEGTLGKLVNDPSMYNNIDSLSVEMNKLLKGINEDPGKYLKHMNIIEIF